jgi:hypothetical protein
MGSGRTEVSRADAERIARDECARCGIVWREPFSIKRGWRNWQIRTPSNRRGGNALILVSRQDGSARARFFAR